MIRKLTKADEQLYMAMTEEFYNSDAVLHAIPEENRRACFEELMRSKEYCECFIIEHNKETAGYALIAKAFSQEAGGLTVWIEELYIRPEFQGNGLGTQFFKFIQKEYPAKRFRLETEPDNEGARALYERLGFKALNYIQMIKDTEQYEA